MPAISNQIVVCQPDALLIQFIWTDASLKDAGRLTFAAALMGAEIIPGLVVRGDACNLPARSV